MSENIILETKTRPSWNDYFMSISKLVSTRSTCVRRKVGAVLVKDRRILATGYNGAPPGNKHCIEVGCLRDKLGIKSGERTELCRGVHAEENCIIQAAKHGICVDGGIIYCTNQRCSTCAKSIVGAGIVSVFFEHPYDDEYGVKIFRDSEVKLIKISDTKACFVE